MNRITTGKPNLLDLEYIKQWLQEEKDKNGHSFLCNWNIVEDAFNKKRIFILREEKNAVAFYTLGSNNTIDIFCVKEDKRKNGYGRKLFEYYEEKIKKKIFSIIQIECCPKESINFWNKMGFISYKKIYSDKLYSYKIIEPKYKNIEFIILEEKENREIIRFQRYGFLSNNHYILNEKVIFDVPKYYFPDEGINENECDLCVQILIDGEEFYKDRLKYGSSFGIQKLNPLLFVINELKRQPNKQQIPNIRHLQIFGSKIDMGPGSFIIKAQQFLDCAKLAADGENRWKYNPARHFLACRSIELSLKAFLCLHGKDFNDLTDEFGHDISSLLEGCSKKGLYEILSLSDKQVNCIQSVSTYYENKFFEYPDCLGNITGGPSRYPDAHELITIADHLITNLFNPCVHTKNETVGYVQVTHIKKDEQ